MLSRRSASARQRSHAEDGRSIPLCEAGPYQRGDPSTSLQSADALFAPLGMTTRS
jgi:hypothetical protein